MVLTAVLVLAFLATDSLWQNCLKLTEMIIGNGIVLLSLVDQPLERDVRDGCNELNVPLHPQSQGRQVRQTLCGLNWAWGLGTSMASGNHLVFGKPPSRWREPSGAQSGQPSRSHWKWPKGDMYPTSWTSFGSGCTVWPACRGLARAWLRVEKSRGWVGSMQRLVGDFSRWILVVSVDVT